MVSDPTGNDPCDFDLAFDLRQHVRYAMSAMHAAFPTLRATENDAAASIVVRAMKRAAEKKRLAKSNGEAGGGGGSGVFYRSSSLKGGNSSSRLPPIRRNAMSKGDSSLNSLWMTGSGATTHSSNSSGGRARKRSKNVVLASLKFEAAKDKASKQLTKQLRSFRNIRSASGRNNAAHDAAVEDGDRLD